MNKRRTLVKMCMVFAAVVLLGSSMIFASGCSSGGGGDKDADVVGTWLLTYDWNCNGTFGQTLWFLYANGSFNTQSGNSGHYSVNGNGVVVNYANGTTYNGNVENNSFMSGTMRSVGTGTSGCWSATLMSRVPGNLAGAQLPVTEGEELGDGAE